MKGKPQAAENSIVEVMRELGMPETRENYLTALFGGPPPEDGIGPEIESMIPDRFKEKAPTHRPLK